MKIIDKYNYPCVTLEANDLKSCHDRANKMCNGASTYSFKHSQSQSEDVYFIGNVGELIVNEFLNHKENLSILHAPFREDYSKFNLNDDFIVENTNGKRQLEVRTKCRNVDPRGDYECCSDSIKPHLTYVFVSYNRVNNLGFIVGWADWDAWKEYGFPTLKGQKNNNFVHKSNEFNILIRHLNTWDTF